MIYNDQNEAFAGASDSKDQARQKCTLSVTGTLDHCILIIGGLQRTNSKGSTEGEHPKFSSLRFDLTQLPISRFFSWVSNFSGTGMSNTGEQQRDGGSYSQFGGLEYPQPSASGSGVTTFIPLQPTSNPGTMQDFEIQKEVCVLMFFSSQ